jgi:CBS domain-containing protein
MALPEFSIASLRTIVSDRSLRHGTEYHEGGCVSKVIASADSYYANVHGHRRYSVRIWNAGGELHTSCTCRNGMERICRHIVAVMLAILRGEEDQTPFKWYEQGQRVDPKEPEKVQEDVAREALTADLAEEAGEEDGPEEAAPDRGARIILAEEIMAGPVISLSPEADLVDAWKLLCEKRFRHVPVVSEEGALVGIVSDRDILLRAALIAAAETANTSHPGGTIREIMQTRVLTSGPTTEIRQIARVFFQERIGAMPIVDGRGKLAGMITRSDILRALIDNDLIGL